MTNEPVKLGLRKWNRTSHPGNNCDEALYQNHSGREGVPATTETVMEPKWKPFANGSTSNMTMKAVKKRVLPSEKNNTNTSGTRFVRCVKEKESPIAQWKPQRRLGLSSQETSMEAEPMLYSNSCRSQIQKEKVVSFSETGPSSNVFRPNRRRPSAPVPSLSRPRVPSSTEVSPRRPFNISRPGSMSYTKHMRSIESCHSPPRRQLPNTCRKPDAANHSIRKRSDLRTPPATSLSEGIDRIEQSRDPTLVAQKEDGLLLGFEDKCKLDPQMEVSNDSPKEYFLPNHLDRIECTRENAGEFSASKIREFKERSDDQCHSSNQKATFKSNSFGKGDEIVSIPNLDQVRSENQKTNHKSTAFSAHSRNVSSSMKLPRDQNFMRSIRYQNFQSLRLKYTEYIQNVIAKTDADEEQSTVDRQSSTFDPMVVIRSRPLLEHEMQEGNYSVIDIPMKSSRTLAMYETNVSPCEEALDLKAHVFQFDAVSSERDSFDNFYSRTVQLSVNNAVEGGLGAIFVYGSDEFGKSNIVSGIEKRLAHDLFPSKSQPLLSSPSIFVTHLGLGSGSSDLCIDLMSSYHHFVEVIESNGTYNAQGATEVHVSSASQLLEAFSTVKQNLASERILRRESESSSYSLCRIAIQKNGNNSKRGLFYLVQCPSGDELCHGNETVSANDRYQLANPLARLMEVIRQNKPTLSSHMDSCYKPPMACNLTKLLGQSFIDSKTESTSVALVAAVSPSSNDTDATLSTLLSSREFMARKACSDSHSENSLNETIETKDAVASETTTEKTDLIENSLLLPRQWSQEQLWEWMQRKRLVAKNIFFEREITGKAIMNMTKDQLREFFYRSEKKSQNGAKKLFDALRAENDRIARLRVKQKFARRKGNK